MGSLSDSAATSALCTIGFLLLTFSPALEKTRRAQRIANVVDQDVVVHERQIRQQDLDGARGLADRGKAHDGAGDIGKLIACLDLLNAGFAPQLHFLVRKGKALAERCQHCRPLATKSFAACSEP